MLTAPAELPSTKTLLMLYPVLGVMVNVWLAPELRVVVPNGEIVPPVPAEEVRVY